MGTNTLTTLEADGIAALKSTALGTAVTAALGDATNTSLPVISRITKVISDLEPQAVALLSAGGVTAAEAEAKTALSEVVVALASDVGPLVLSLI